MENALDHQEPAAETSNESTRSARTISNYRYRFNRLHRLTLERMKYCGLPPDERLGIADSVKDIRRCESIKAIAKSEGGWMIG